MDQSKETPNNALWYGYQCPSGNIIFYYNKKTGEYRWAKDLSESEHNVIRINISDLPMVDVHDASTQTEDYGCINGCSSIYITKHQNNNGLRFSSLMGTRELDGTTPSVTTHRSRRISIARIVGSCQSTAETRDSSQDMPNSNYDDSGGEKLSDPDVIDACQSTVETRDSSHDMPNSNYDDSGGEKLTSDPDLIDTCQSTSLTPGHESTVLKKTTYCMSPRNTIGNEHCCDDDNSVMIARCQSISSAQNPSVNRPNDIDDNNNEKESVVDTTMIDCRESTLLSRDHSYVMTSREMNDSTRLSSATSETEKSSDQDDAGVDGMINDGCQSTVLTCEDVSNCMDAYDKERKSSNACQSGTLSCDQSNNVTHADHHNPEESEVIDRRHSSVVSRDHTYAIMPSREMNGACPASCSRNTRRMSAGVIDSCRSTMLVSNPLVSNNGVKQEPRDNTTMIDRCQTGKTTIDNHHLETPELQRCSTLIDRRQSTVSTCHSSDNRVETQAVNHGPKTIDRRQSTVSTCHSSDETQAVNHGPKMIDSHQSRMTTFDFSDSQPVVKQELRDDAAMIDTCQLTVLADLLNDIHVKQEHRETTVIDSHQSRRNLPTRFDNEKEKEVRNHRLGNLPTFHLRHLSVLLQDISFGPDILVRKTNKTRQVTGDNVERSSGCRGGKRPRTSTSLASNRCEDAQRRDKSRVETAEHIPADKNHSQGDPTMCGNNRQEGSNCSRVIDSCQSKDVPPKCANINQELDIDTALNDSCHSQGDPTMCCNNRQEGSNGPIVTDSGQSKDFPPKCAYIKQEGDCDSTLNDSCQSNDDQPRGSCTTLNDTCQSKDEQPMSEHTLNDTCQSKDDQPMSNHPSDNSCQSKDNQPMEGDRGTPINNADGLSSSSKPESLKRKVGTRPEMNKKKRKDTDDVTGREEKTNNEGGSSVVGNPKQSQNGNNVEKPFQCSHCGRQSQSISDLDCHVKEYAAKKPLKCSYCDKTFFSKCHVRDHERVHTGEKPFKCLYCDKAFVTQVSLKLHLLEHTLEKRFICEVCGKAYAKKKHYDAHLRLHSVKKLFGCTKCDKVFSRRTTLREHVLQVHAFTRDKNLEHQIHVHTEERPFKCTVCGDSFERELNMREHLKTHSNEKLFQCAQSCKEFAENEEFEDRLRTHSNEKPFKCSNCQKEFVENEELVDHLGTRSSEKPYKCSHCDKEFQKNEELVAHLGTHSSEKPFKCSHGREEFAENKELVDHRGTHSSEKPFQCLICGKMFCLETSLTTHIEIHFERQQNIYPHCEAKNEEIPIPPTIVLPQGSEEKETSELKWNLNVNLRRFEARSNIIMLEEL